LFVVVKVGRIPVCGFGCRCTPVIYPHFPNPSSSDLWLPVVHPFPTSCRSEQIKPNETEDAKCTRKRQIILVSLYIRIPPLASSGFQQAYPPLLKSGPLNHLTSLFIHLSVLQHLNIIGLCASFSLGPPTPHSLVLSSL